MAVETQLTFDYICKVSVITIKKIVRTFIHAETRGHL